MSEEPDKTLLNQLRVLETKMGLVMTLVSGKKASLDARDAEAFNLVQSFGVGCYKRTTDVRYFDVF